MLPTMLRVALALLLPLALCACGQSDNNPAPDPSKTAVAPDRGFVFTEINPAPDALMPAIQGEVKKAKSQGLKPYVELWASWCEPCMAIKHSLDDDRMKAAFKGTYVIQVYADAWGQKLAGTGFKASVIPIFYEVGDDGKPTGRTIDGGAWGDNIPANMAPPLDRFFHGG